METKRTESIDITRRRIKTGRFLCMLKYWAKEILAVSAVLLMGALIGAIITLSLTGYKADIRVTDESAVINIIQPGMGLQKIAKDLAESHNYTLGYEVQRDTYDSNGTINGTETAIEGRYACDNFSRDLIQELENNGYSAEYCSGDALWCMPWEKESKSCRHAWVKTYIYIEAVTGEILDPREYRMNYVEEGCRSLTP